MQKRNISIKTERIYTQKFRFKNINFSERKFYTLEEDIPNKEYFNSLPEGLKKLYVREYFYPEDILDKYHHIFPFGLFLYRKSRCFYTGKIRVRYHIQNYKNFGVDLYLEKYWGGYDAGHLKEFSPLDFDFYIELLFEKIAYSSKKEIVFFMEIDFNLKGESYENPFDSEEERRENIRFGKNQHYIAIYR